MLNGLEATTPTDSKLVNAYAHLNDLPIFHSENYFSSYAFAHQTKDDPVHDLPYGYEMGDDPFDTQGRADYYIYLMFFGGWALLHTLYCHVRFVKGRVGEDLFHQRLVAGQIEDRIRKIRAERA